MRIMAKAFLTTTSHVLHLTQKRSMAAWQGLKWASHLFCWRARSMDVCIYTRQSKIPYHSGTLQLFRMRGESQTPRLHVRNPILDLNAAISRTLMSFLYPEALQASF